MLPILDLCAAAFCVLLSVFFTKKIINNEALHFMPRMSAVYALEVATADESLDGDTVDGAIVVGRDTAFIQPVDSRVLYK